MPDTVATRRFLERQALDWRDRAEEFRTVGENTRSPQARQILLELARNWDDMAGKLETRLKTLVSIAPAPAAAERPAND
jgi:hypothetical protein